MAQCCWSFPQLISAPFLYNSCTELLMNLFLSCWPLISLKFSIVPHCRKKFCLNCLHAIPFFSFYPLSQPLAFEYGAILSTTEYQTDIGFAGSFFSGRCLCSECLIKVIFVVQENFAYSSGNKHLIYTIENMNANELFNLLGQWHWFWVQWVREFKGKKEICSNTKRFCFNVISPQQRVWQEQ